MFVKGDARDRHARRHIGLERQKTIQGRPESFAVHREDELLDVALFVLDQIDGGDRLSCLDARQIQFGGNRDLLRGIFRGLGGS